MDSKLLQSRLKYSTAITCSFRDLLTAVYIKNIRLSKVEKLFHLSVRTSGEAKDIVSKAPLVNEGFDIAWTAHCHRFDNNRMLINAQLRMLFMLPFISTESAKGIKTFQNSVNNSISALQFQKVDVTNWDWIFIYLCSIRLPEITLSMWEQKVKERNEMPTLYVFDQFLTTRYQTLHKYFIYRRF